MPQIVAGSPPAYQTMIVATAGHVDHGKTTLIKALTGVDTDRLPEEKKRGLSIDLGFAFMGTDGAAAESIGFIDVPGHEKFVRNMIAGVGSIDLALLVVAADDGPMPQTREHLAILQLLGVRAVIVVMTKSDLVDSATQAATIAKLQALIDASAFPASEIVAVSAGDVDAIEQLRRRLIDFAKVHSKVYCQGHFRLAIDRSFSVTGAGTVVTGTVLSGAVRLEDSIFAVSQRAHLRVRGIHAQNQSVDVAKAGQRCALNVSGSDIKNISLKRGGWLTSNDQLQTVRTLDVSITPAPVFDSGDAQYFNNDLKHWTAAHLHLATASVTCRIALLENQSLKVGEYGLARLICEQPLPAVNGDRFVLRDQSARHTIAGGVVIDPLPPKRGRSRPQRLQVLHAMNTATTPENTDAIVVIDNEQVNADSTGQALAALLSLCKNGVDLQLFAVQYNVRDREISEYCTQFDVVVCQYGARRWGIKPAHWDSLKTQLLVTLDNWHTAHPNVLGANAEQLRKALPENCTQTVFLQALEELVEHKLLLRKGAVYKHPLRESRLDDDHESIWLELQKLFEPAGNIAPRVNQISEVLGKTNEEVLQLLNTFVAHGRLYRVSANRYYTPEVLHQLARAGEQLAKADNFTVSAFRDVSGIGRNLVIELLEFFDRSRFTRRIGQKRIVMQSSSFDIE